MALSHEMATIADVLPAPIIKHIIALLKSMTRDGDYLTEQYTFLDPEDQAKRGAYGKVRRVRSNETNNIYAIKRVVLKKSGGGIAHNFTQFLQECVLGYIGSHPHLVSAHRDLNWIVLPESLDATDVMSLVEQGAQLVLTDLHKFVGKYYQLQFIFSLVDVCEQD